MKVTISGKSGSGSTSLAEALAHELGYPFYSIGNIYREVAKENDMSIEELDSSLESHAEYDKEMDERQRRFGMSHDDCVVDSRMGWHLIPDSFKILVTADDALRMERIARKESLNAEDAQKLDAERESLHAKRFSDMYGVDNIFDPSHYDLVIESTDRPTRELVQEIQATLAQYH